MPWEEIAGFCEAVRDWGGARVGDASLGGLRRGICSRARFFDASRCAFSRLGHALRDAASVKNGADQSREVPP